MQVSTLFLEWDKRNTEVARQRSGAQTDNIRKYRSKVWFWNKHVWLNKKALDEANLFYYELSSLYSKIWLFTKNTKI